MDTCLDADTIEVLEQLAGVKCLSVERNSYKPYSDYKCTIEGVGVKSLGAKFCKKVRAALDDGKKIVSFCGSKHLLDVVKEFMSDYKVLALHGVGEESEGEWSSHEEYKQYFTTDVNRIYDEKPDLLIYTGTITSGLDI
jgi:hypothetical protein